MTPTAFPDPAEAGTGTASPLVPSARPRDVPAKFWDATTGTIRVEALLASYLELERKLGVAPAPNGATPDPTTLTGTSAPTAEGLSEPAVAEPISVATESTTGEPIEAPPGADPRVDAFLRSEGFTDRQIRIVYALGEACLEPMLNQARAELAARHDLARLDMHFGGPGPRAKACARLSAWGRTNLPPGLYGAMAGSYEGVLAMERLAGLADAQGEPKPLRGGRGSGPLSEGQLRALMRDPKYWRDGDPDLMNRVRDGFRQLYPG